MGNHLPRRVFVGGLGVGALVLGFDPAGRAWVAEAAADSGPLERVPPLDGELLVDPGSREEAADDYGHMVRHHPRAVLRPGSVSDVAVMLRYCRARGIPVAARGQGHSTNGQSQVEAGLVVETGTLDDIRVEGDRAVVQAGALWSDLLRRTLPHGLTPPVLTDYLELSVGGTLSVGGVGGATHRHGAQVDGVLELEVVTGAGHRVVCSPTRRADLFRAALAGLGQCAVVTSATVGLVPAPDRVRRYQLRYPEVAALTADQRRVAADGRFEYLEGSVQPDGTGGWVYVLEAVAFWRDGSAPDDAALTGDLSHETGTEEVDDLSYLDFADRLAPSVAYLRSTGEWYDPHPWWNVFVPGSAVDSFVESVMADLTPADIGPTGVVLLYPFGRPLLGAPLLRVPDDPEVFLFALLKTATPGPGAPTPEEMVEANRSLYERVRDLGGYQYPVGTVPMSEDDWRRHFGDAWPDLAAAKQKYDPRNILAPGQGVFPR
ncbi:FAD-binding protein [Actinorugispora endophytica]|nr:FAD-binding protein [Actinorugispora endophytica]